MQQARAPQTQPFGSEAFDTSSGTVLRWLGMAGFLLNSRGTTVMIDPLLGGFDMPVMIDFPITTGAVPRLDAILITHSDNDHYSGPTCRDLAPVTAAFHSTRYVDTLMRAENFPSTGHDIGDRFTIGQIQVDVTPADHAWQSDVPGAADGIFQPEDCCGFWLTTPDGTVWAPGDSRLIPEHHLQMPTPDAMLFDFSSLEQSCCVRAGERSA
jgi:L-ascorbate metabolism protein UlaG (beta-lactamase superfamily)